MAKMASLHAEGLTDDDLETAEIAAILEEVFVDQVMKKQLINNSIIIGGLIVAILFIFVVAIPFVMSNNFDKLVLSLITH